MHAQHSFPIPGAAPARRAAASARPGATRCRAARRSPCCSAPPPRMRTRRCPPAAGWSSIRRLVQRSWRQRGISHIAQGGPHLIINWDSFNIAEGKQVVFRQPYPSAVALNRVIGNSASQILGQLNANGQIFLVSTNGILFGPNSQVNVGALAASTLALSNRDFLGGRDYRYATQGKSAKVVNQGSLNARAGGFRPWSAGRWTTRNGASARRHHRHGHRQGDHADAHRQRRARRADR